MTYGVGGSARPCDLALETGAIIRGGTRCGIGGTVIRPVFGSVAGAVGRAMRGATRAGTPDRIVPAVVADDVAFPINGGAAGQVTADVNGGAMVAMATSFGLRGGTEEDEGKSGDSS